MKKNIRLLTHGALIAALYVVLSHLQNVLLPGSTTQMIQFRVSEALCVMALFTPAAIPGLTLGCLLFNVVSGAGPWDFVIGTAASCFAAVAMFATRKITVKGYPALSMLMPAVCNGFMVGPMLAYFFGGGLWLNIGCVALGEIGVLFTLGTVLFYSLRKHKNLFG